ncbi:DsbA family protein [Corynebacterium uterequi]|uniref:DSBA-like thioredoxin domain-containing protein n=1 Tax=Corynebacterium uterequi TaxID=1072256 RepID=A0A0G3HCW9_9CORY|nr:DsbA family protein [Corynebacterium uterequi]AKK11119.1 putative protein-disulfide isomerase [Corynebacterium uterequi]
MSPTGDKIQFLYAFDALCGWCYGFGPALMSFTTANAERIDVDVRSGGLFTGSRVMPVRDFTHAAESNVAIAKATGAVFGEGYEAMIAEGSTVMDSTYPAKGLIALRRQIEARAEGSTSVALVQAAEAIHKAWYLDGKDLSNEQVYRAIAKDLGLDADAVAADFASSDTTRGAQQEFVELSRLGVTRFPTLIMATERGPRVFGSPTATGEQLTEILDAYLDGRIS